MLGLIPVGTQQGLGAAGSHQLELFPAHLQIKIQDKLRGEVVLGMDQVVQGIPELEKSPTPLLKGRSFELVGLVGRDLLRHAHFRYDGRKGSLEFVFDLDSLPRRL